MSNAENPSEPDVDPPLETRINPYAPTAIAGELPQFESELSTENIDLPTTLRRTAFRWLVVCGISAIPSFFYGLSLTDGRVGGMIVGILIFVAAYTMLDYQTAPRPFRRRKTVRRTLKIVYGTRITISLLFPIGLYLDLICGLLSVSLIQAIMGNQFSQSNAMPFGVSLLTTIVQGSVLNVVLGFYGLLILTVQVVINAFRR